MNPPSSKKVELFNVGRPSTARPSSYCLPSTTVFIHCVVVAYQYRHRPLAGLAPSAIIINTYRAKKNRGRAGLFKELDLRARSNKFTRVTTAQNFKFCRIFMFSMLIPPVPQKRRQHQFVVVAVAAGVSAVSS
jgi:hypothetical protein